MIRISVILLFIISSALAKAQNSRLAGMENFISAVVVPTAVGTTDHNQTTANQLHF